MFLTSDILVSVFLHEKNSFAEKSKF